ncbi:MAG: helicase-related protein, partial [Legionella sp.]|nr:helicase-related protein [Legionella sp.]
TPCFKFDRNKGINAGILCPLLIDNSLPDDLSLTDVKFMIENHIHPDEQNTTLQHHKGIIYVNSLDEAAALAEILEQIPSGPEIYQVHSGTKNKKNTLNEFKEASTGIAIAVRLLKEGYDDNKAGWMLSLKNTHTPSDLIQMLGRCLRKEDNDEKTALGLFKSTVRQESDQTWFAPEGMKRPSNYMSAEERLDAPAMQDDVQPPAIAISSSPMSFYYPNQEEQEETSMPAPKRPRSSYYAEI